MQNPGSPRAKARSLAGEALRHRGTAEGYRLADEALALDPDCVDALLAQVPPLEEGTARLREVVDFARRQLGEEVFEKQRGSFWGEHETRPFIRALQHLATNCLLNSDYDGCAVACEEILSLNEKDNLGVRELMLTIHLRRGDEAAARELVKRFPGVESAAWNWLVFLLESRFGRSEQARVLALGDAVRVNRHVVHLLFAADSGGVHTETVLGSFEEAANAMVLLVRAMENDPASFLKWLALHVKQIAERKMAPSPPLS